ncbi:hypothetical protein DIE18_03010 [Burkholderia sp. Bp9125]|nr:hypothetical protein DIE18_03010 [Burkholderia sp. Bp9125]
MTPLRLYLLIICGLVLLVTSPFTIGPGLAWLGAKLSHAFDVISASVAAVQWPAHYPALCWLSKAVLGAHLVGGLGLCFWKGEFLCASGRRLATVVLALLAGTAMYGWLSSFDPSVQSLYDAFLTAGGAPVWLVGGATAVIVVLATSPVIAVALAAVVSLYLRAHFE